MEALDKLPENIKFKLEIVDNHWLWTGGTTNSSHPKGRVRFNGSMEYPHRVIMHILRGFRLDSKLQINHQRECTESLCCNPDHLYIGDQQENVEDSIALGHNKELKKTQCSTCGGKYSTSPTTGHRYCQRCKNLRRSLWRIDERHKK